MSSTSKNKLLDIICDQETIIVKPKMSTIMVFKASNLALCEPCDLIEGGPNNVRQSEY